MDTEDSAEVLKLTHEMAEDYAELGTKWLAGVTDPRVLQERIAAMAINQSSVVQLALMDAMPQPFNKDYGDWCLDTYRQVFQGYIDISYTCLARHVQKAENPE